MNETVQIVSIIFGFAGVIASSVFGYRQIKLTTSTSKQVDVYAEQTKRIDQVIDGMQKIIDNLTNENLQLKQQLIGLQNQLTDVRKQLDLSIAQKWEVESNLATVTRQYNDLKGELKSKHIIENGYDKPKNGS